VQQKLPNYYYYIGLVVQILFCHVKSWASSFTLHSNSAVYKSTWCK